MAIQIFVQKQPILAWWLIIHFEKPKYEKFKGFGKVALKFWNLCSIFLYKENAKLLKG